jgi:uncharacterized protein involved in exopolysaccharide biosynthesis
MEEQDQLTYGGSRRFSFSYTLRDFLAVGFRHRGLILLSFLGIFLGAVIFTVLRPNQYETQIKLLLNRERLEPMVSPVDQSLTPRLTSTPNVSEQDQNSEVELLKSRDLLEKVVVACGLDERPENNSWWDRLFLRMGASAGVTTGQAADKTAARAAAVEGVLKLLTVEPVIKSNVVTVTYRAPNPQQAARVLNTLADLYLEKHLEVHRPAGTLRFFQQETERYRKGLTDIEARLSDFGRAEGVASAQLEKENTLKSLSAFEAKLMETKAEVAQTEERIRGLESQLTTTPPRMTTDVHTSDNQFVLEKLKSTLSTLELKRIELLGKYEPSYRVVQELDKQIAETRDFLAAEQNVKLHTESSGRNPTYEILAQELAKARSELPALQALAAKMDQQVLAYREKCRRLYQKELAQNDLLRTQKIAEGNYQLYFQKQEEARISDALDKQGILNVSVVERATLPTHPAGIPRSLILLLGGILAGMLSVGLAFASDLLATSFRTPDEVREFLGVPVLATIPKGAR